MDLVLARGARGCGVLAQLDLVLGLGRFNRLPLHVPRAVSTASRKGHDVVYHVAGATIRVARFLHELVLRNFTAFDPALLVASDTRRVAAPVGRAVWIGRDVSAGVWRTRRIVGPTWRRGNVPRCPARIAPNVWRRRVAWGAWRVAGCAGCVARRRRSEPRCSRRIASSVWRGGVARSARYVAWRAWQVARCARRVARRSRRVPATPPSNRARIGQEHHCEHRAGK